MVEIFSLSLWEGWYMENRQIFCICPYYWGDSNSLYTFKEPMLSTAFSTCLSQLSCEFKIFMSAYYCTISSVRPTKLLEFNMSQPLFIITPLSSPPICSSFLFPVITSYPPNYKVHKLVSCPWLLPFLTLLSLSITKPSHVCLLSISPTRLALSNSSNDCQNPYSHHFLYLAPSSCNLEWQS